MNVFHPGDKYKLLYSACPRAGRVAGYVEIISIDRVPESELQFRDTSIEGNFVANAGEITYIVHSDSTSLKKKKSKLTRNRHGKEYAERYCGGVLECEWFSPTKRSYYCISTTDSDRKI